MNKLAPKIITILSGAASLLPALAYAQLEPPSEIGILGSGGANTFIGLMCLVARWVFTVAIILSIILAIMTAIQYMTSSGEPEKLKTAHRRLLYLAVGIAVAILARTLPVLVGAALQAPGTEGLGGVCS